MGDFFTRLAEKTLGLAPVVQPDLMPVAQPAADGEVVSDSLPGWKKPSSARLRLSNAPPQQADSQAGIRSATVAGDGPQSLTQGWDQAVALPARDDRAVNRQLEAPMPMTQAKQNVVELDGTISIENLKLARKHRRLRFANRPMQVLSWLSRSRPR